VSLLVFTAAIAAVAVLRHQPPPGPFTSTDPANPAITDPAPAAGAPVDPPCPGRPRPLIRLRLQCRRGAALRRPPADPLSRPCLKTQSRRGRAA